MACVEVPEIHPVKNPSALFLLALSLLASSFAMPAAASTTGEPVNFLYVGAGELERHRPLLRRPDIAGVQVVYSWKALETAPGVFDFSAIEADLRVMETLNKKMFVQIQDRFFEPGARHVPRYLLEDPRYGGGLVPQFDNPGENKPPTIGWVAQQWNPAVRERYQNLLKALASRFDGQVYGVNLPETAIDIDAKADRSGFSCDRYFEAEMENLAVARQAFKKSFVVQYVNFWPCEWDNSHNYMGRLFAYAADHGIGLGGPDIVPGRKGQMKNSYPFFNRYKGRLAMVAMAVQEPTLTYTNPATRRPFTRTEFSEYAMNYLGAGIIFWSPQSPWLKR